MEDLVIFRIFLTFPLVGLLIPKAGVLFSGATGYISAGDIIIAISLSVSVMVCSLGIIHEKRKLHHTGIKGDDAMLSA
jgi:hypothetical protein